MSAMTSTVFVVDDDPAVCRALTRLIRSAGYRVEAFASAHEFLECCPDIQGCAACLVLDVGLPDINGLELQNEWRCCKNRRCRRAFTRDPKFMKYARTAGVQV
jgi:FixJ family two-component response regulator